MAMKTNDILEKIKRKTARQSAGNQAACRICAYEEEYARQKPHYEIVFADDVR
ncbi:MAG: hypothetical protein IJD63_00215 [Oscillospiraceae bacterium]|nr:hypothetical protein [Oscillospiraceae bacterium]